MKLVIIYWILLWSPSRWHLSLRLCLLPCTNKLVKTPFKHPHWTSQCFFNRIKCGIKIKISDDDYFQFAAYFNFVCFRRCVLINGERILRSLEAQEKHGDLNRSTVRPCPKACFHFFLRTFFPASLIVTWVNRDWASEIFNYHSARSTYEPWNCVLVTQCCAKISLLFLPINRTSYWTARVGRCSRGSKKINYTLFGGDEKKLNNR